MKNKLMHDRLTVRRRHKSEQDTSKPERRGESALGEGGLNTYFADACKYMCGQLLWTVCVRVCSHQAALATCKRSQTGSSLRDSCLATARPKRHLAGPWQPAC